MVQNVTATDHLENLGVDKGHHNGYKGIGMEMHIVLNWLAKRCKRGNDDNGELWSYITRNFLANPIFTDCELSTREYGMRVLPQVIITTLSSSQCALGVWTRAILAWTIGHHLWSRCARKRPLGRPRRKCTDSVKIDFWEVGWKDGV
jgi:hypothetical protein